MGYTLKLFFIVLVAFILTDFLNLKAKAEGIYILHIIERYLTPDEVQEDEETETLPPNPYVIKKDNKELEEEFDKPDLLAENEGEEDLSDKDKNKKEKKVNKGDGISKKIK